MAEEDIRSRVQGLLDSGCTVEELCCLEDEVIKSDAAAKVLVPRFNDFEHDDQKRLFETFTMLKNGALPDAVTLTIERLVSWFWAVQTEAESFENAVKKLRVLFKDIDDSVLLSRFMKVAPSTAQKVKFLVNLGSAMDSVSSDPQVQKAAKKNPQVHTFIQRLKTTFFDVDVPEVESEAVMGLWLTARKNRTFTLWKMTLDYFLNDAPENKDLLRKSLEETFMNQHSVFPPSLLAKAPFVMLKGAERNPIFQGFKKLVEQKLGDSSLYKNYVKDLPEFSLDLPKFTHYLLQAADKGSNPSFKEQFEFDAEKGLICFKNAARGAPPAHHAPPQMMGSPVQQPAMAPQNLPPPEQQAAFLLSKGVPPDALHAMKGKGKMGEVFVTMMAKHKGKGAPPNAMNGANNAAVLPPPGMQRPPLGVPDYYPPEQYGHYPPPPEFHGGVLPPPGLLPPPGHIPMGYHDKMGSPYDHNMNKGGSPYDKGGLLSPPPPLGVVPPPLGAGKGQQGAPPAGPPGNMSGMQKAVTMVQSWGDQQALQALGIVIKGQKGKLPQEALVKGKKALVERLKGAGKDAQEFFEILAGKGDDQNQQVMPPPNQPSLMSMMGAPPSGPPQPTAQELLQQQMNAAVAAAPPSVEQPAVASTLLPPPAPAVASQSSTVEVAAAPPTTSTTTADAPPTGVSKSLFDTYMSQPPPAAPSTSKAADLFGDEDEEKKPKVGVPSAAGGKKRKKVVDNTIEGSENKEGSKTSESAPPMKKAKAEAKAKGKAKAKAKTKSK